MIKQLAMTMLCAAGASAAGPGAWTAPVEVRHEENLCLSYRARVDGPYLVIQATIEPGWHTFSMDNKVRAEEKLAGKKSLGIDHPTEFSPTAGIALEGPWYQTPPKDFSKPELRWFSWGFEKQAQFAVKLRGSAAGGRIGVRGQACTETICKNIDVTIVLPQSKSSSSASPEVNLSHLVRVR